MNLNLTRSRRWRLRDATSGRGESVASMALARTATPSSDLGFLISCMSNNRFFSVASLPADNATKARTEPMTALKCPVLIIMPCFTVSGFPTSTGPCVSPVLFLCNGSAWPRDIRATTIGLSRSQVTQACHDAEIPLAAPSSRTTGWRWFASTGSIQ